MATMRRPLAPASLVNAAVVLAAAGFVLSQLHPSLLVTDTTPAGGDMGAHVWAPAYLRDHLLPSGLLTGWTNDWYAGFPALHFYFPLPSLLIVLLNVALPYGVAFKLVSVSGLLATPVCAYWMGRLLSLRDPAPAFFALATLPFLYDRFHTIYGGNIAATLAGEFSFSISLALSLLFLGLFARGLETGRHRAAAAAVLSAAFLSHLLPTFFALAGAAVLLLLRLDRNRLRYALTTLPVAGLLAGMWALPFAYRLPYSNDMGWEKITAYAKNLFPFLSGCGSDGTCGPGEFQWVQTWHLIPVVLLAFGGVGYAIVRRYGPGLFLSLMAAIPAVVFVVAPSARLWNARALPFWFLSLYLLAALAAAQAVTAGADALARRADAPPPGDDALFAVGRPRRRWAIDGRALATVGAPLMALAGTLVFVGLPVGALPSWFPLDTTDRSFVPDWARWNYSGYERKDGYPEYRAVVATMGRVGIEHGCGRAMWEYEPGLDRYGTPMALMLLPYWTDGCIASMEGLFFESAATTPYHFLNQSELSKSPSRAQRDLPYRNLDVDAGVGHLQLLGVRYYMALSPEAINAADANPDLTRIASSGPWRVYEVDGSELVTPLTKLPAVVRDWPNSNGDWLDVAVPWYQDPSRWDVPLAQSGPDGWPVATVTVDEGEGDSEIVGTGVTVSTTPAQPVTPATVTDVRLDEMKISFDVDRPGTPVLVKASYFPNWKASGADGPWRVTPNLMVVVPTERHVELRYGRTPIDLAGIGATLLGLAALVLLARSRPVHYPPPVREGAEQLAFDFAPGNDGDGDTDGAAAPGRTVPAAPGAPEPPGDGEVWAPVPSGRPGSDPDG